MTMDKSPRKNSKSKKRSSKKKKNDSKSDDSSGESPSSASTSTAVETTPAKLVSDTPAERTANQAEECKMLEWLYYNRLHNSNQCVVWGSPQGSPNFRSDSRGRRGPSSPSPDCRLEQRKPPRRLLTASASCDGPDYMFELTALSERLRAQEELSKQSSHKSDDESTSVISVIEDNDLSDTQNIKEFCGPPKVPDLEYLEPIQNESFSALFDDDDDLMNECMLRCSQEVEEKLKLDKVVSPRRSAQCSTPKSGRKRLLHARASPGNTCPKTTPRKTPKLENKCVAQFRQPGVQFVVNGRNIAKMDTSSSVKPNCTARSDLQCEIADDSFEAALQNFMDEDIDLISQALSKPQSVKFSPQLSSVQHTRRAFVHKTATCALQNIQNKSKGAVHINEQRSEHILEQNGLSVCVQREVERKPLKQSNKQTNCGNPPVVLQDSFLVQTEMFELFDTAETSNVSCSPPLQCTPEEIEKKKQEAKMKLEKKRMSTLAERNKPVINPYGRQLHRPLMTKRMK